MKLLSAVAFLALVGGPAIAGCVNYEDEGFTPPVVEICYGSKCDITIQEYVCSSVYQASTSYKIGWAVQAYADSAGYISWQGRKISPDLYQNITCREIVGNGTGCEFLTRD